MKKMFCVALITIVSMSLILGTSPVFAQTEEGEKVVEPPTVVRTDNQTIPKEFIVNDAFMEELNRLLRALEEAEHKGDQVLTEALREKIRVLKEEISQTNEKSMREIGEPRVIKQPGSPDVAPEVVITEPPVPPREGTVSETTTIA